MHRRLNRATCAVVCAACVFVELPSATMAVTIDLVPVGDPDNEGNPNFGGAAGRVGYVFSMGAYEVTAGQYTEFLNAVAATDSYGLYSTYMDTAVNRFGCNIKRSGLPGSYTYVVPPDWANRPVNTVSWGDAARFVNWLTNGQPRGMQGQGTTEDGSYLLNGAVSNTQLNRVSRKSDARFVLPNWDEWNKAAYYDPNKPGGPGYWRVPTRSDWASNDMSATGSANANFWDEESEEPESYTIGAPYWRTEVGAFAGSPGPWGTYDQGGNVCEWSEGISPDGTYRAEVGGSFHDPLMFMYGVSPRLPTSENATLGFRVALVPEPASLILLLWAGAAYQWPRRPARKRIALRPYLEERCR